MKQDMDRFDNRIRESLEGFEMPYDAGAWTALEQKLPAAPAGASGSGMAWKAVAVIAVVVTTVATALYLNQETELVAEDTPVAGQTESTDNGVQPHPTGISVETAANEPSDPDGNLEGDRNQAVIAVKDSETDRPVAEKSVAVNTVDTELTAEAGEQTEQPVSQTGEPVNETPAVGKPFTVRFIPSARTVCAGEDISFINESSDAEAAMSWDFGDGITSTEGNPVHSYVLPGTYTVLLLGRKNGEGEGFSITVKVNAAPMPMLSASRKLQGFEAIPLYVFTTALQPTESAVWSFSDGTRLSGNSAEHLFGTAGTSTAKLTVTNGFGCATSVDRTYNIPEDFNLLAPTAFTPDGDGINETFMPAVLAHMGVEFELTIKDPRTGNVVHRTADPLDPWNGRLNNTGQTMQGGIYVWTVVLKENIVNNKVFKNTVSLLR